MRYSELIIREKPQARGAAIPGTLLYLFQLLQNTCDESHVSLPLEARDGIAVPRLKRPEIGYPE